MTDNGNAPPTESTITLTRENHRWVATEERTGAVGRGETREEALERVGAALDEATEDGPPGGDEPRPERGDPDHLAGLPVGVLRLDGDLRITDANDRIEELVGAGDPSGGQLRGTDVRDLPIVTADGDPFERLRDGEEVDFEARSTETDADLLGRGAPVVRDGASDGAVLAFVDVSERKERERSLREDANLLDQLFRQVPASLYVKDTEGRHVRISQYDSDPQETIGKTDLEIYGEELARESYADDMQVIETGEPIINKEEYNPDNEQWTLTSKVPWYDEEGNVTGLIGVTRFITERKEYEQALKREKERFERFASVVAHDLRNPLNVASGNLERARQTRDDPELETVQSALDRMAELIENALALARQGEAVTDPDVVELSEAVEAAWESIEADGAELHVDGDYAFEADRSRLVQLFENLARNAVEHGTPDTLATDDTVESGAVDAENRRAALTVRVGPLADENGFYFEDDGPGIPENRREDVFETGYTTAEGGTGFGLGIVNEIVEAHGWDIRVTDGSEGGARFEIRGVTPALQESRSTR